jgi:hypothetical protein
MYELIAWELVKQHTAELERRAERARLVRAARPQRRRGEHKTKGERVRNMRVTTRNNVVWRRVLDAVNGLGDAVSTPRGEAPDRTALGVRSQAERH